MQTNFNRPEFEFVQHHSKASIESLHWSPEVIHATVKDEIKHLYKGRKCQKENAEKARQVSPAS